MCEGGGATSHDISTETSLLIRGGFRCLCRVQDIACYRMRMGIIGDPFARSVADNLNIYYEQFPCVGTPKFQS